LTTYPTAPLFREFARFGEMLEYLSLSSVFHHHEHPCRVVEPAKQAYDVGMPELSDTCQDVESL
jgi:hypothetical protein